MDPLPNKWYSKFLGVGYRYHDVDMNVLLLFGDRWFASGLWNKSIDGWADNQIKLMFVEENDHYWILLFQEGSSLLQKENMGFIKSIPISENYKKFKDRYEYRVILRFAIYNDKIERKKSNKSQYDIRLLKKIKYVYGVSFSHYKDISEHSFAFDAIAKARVLND